jgi:predicted Zn finger-like uncharacterized protein
VDYRCLSCRAKYAIPDARIAAAGPDGLRVRCSRCRAIMAVTAASSASPSPSPIGPTTAVATGVFLNPFASVALPSSLGVGGGEAGSREVTGVFLPLLSSADAPKHGSAHFWAAIAGRPRGPFTAGELTTLAEAGKVRAGTLIWRPGASSWHPLKDVTEFDVSWLRDAVVRRRRREQAAEQEALARRGIAPVVLTRQAAGAVATSTWDVALQGSASALPLPGEGEGTGSFEWRAPTAPSSPGRILIGAIPAAVGGALAAVGLAALASWLVG